MKDNYDVDLSTLDTMKAYEIQVSRYPVLSRGEITKLFDEMHNGSKEAKDKIIKSNLRLVILLAKRLFQGTNDELLEFVSMGNIGLMNAVNSYDPSKGYAFSTYASRAIINNIRKEIPTLSTIPISPEAYQLLAKYHKICNEFAVLYNAEPTVEYVAKELGITMEYASLIVKYDQPITRLDAPIDSEDEESGIYLDSYQSEDASVDELVIHNDMKTNVKKAIECLDEDEKNILFSYYGITCKRKTQEVLACEYGVTKQAISGRIKRLEKRLKNNPYAQGYKDY